MLLASVLCLVFMVGEVVGGILSNSLAIATDAAHLLTGKRRKHISLIRKTKTLRTPRGSHPLLMNYFRIDLGKGSKKKYGIFHTLVGWVGLKKSFSIKNKNNMV